MDEFSPFRYYLNKARNRRNRKNERYGTDLTLEDLKSLWERQKGVCPYTGYKMLLPRTGSDKKTDLRFASLDRIDSTKGYVKGNIEFVCLAVNYAKNEFKKEQLLDFFKNAPVRNKKTKSGKREEEL